MNIEQKHYFSSRILLSTCLLMTLFLGGCAKYRPKPLNAPVGIAQDKKEISITASKLNNLDCSYYFNREIVSKGYQPIQLFIQNRSDQALILDAHNIDLELESVSRVSRSLHDNTAERVVLWCIPALIIWPFIIPATVDGLKSAEANRQLDRDFAQRSLDASGTIVIPPYSFMNKVCFVTAQNYRQEFELILTDRKGIQYSFNMHL